MLEVTIIPLYQVILCKEVQSEPDLIISSGPKTYYKTVKIDRVVGLVEAKDHKSALFKARALARKSGVETRKVKVRQVHESASMTYG